MAARRRVEAAHFESIGRRCRAIRMRWQGTVVAGWDVGGDGDNDGDGEGGEW